MNNLKTMNENLIKLYEAWLQTLIDNELFYKKDKDTGEIKRLKDYSNPYFVGIPKNWDKQHIRIMIVGEEGYGEIGKKWNEEGTEYSEIYKPNNIEELQIANLQYVNHERVWNYINIKSTNKDTINTSRFWKVFKKIEYLDTNITIEDTKKKKSDKVAVIWNECDKICHTTDKCKLSESERTKLHKNLSIDILKEEIKILQPTHIVFLGWYSKSLKVNKWAKWGKEDKFNFELDSYTPDDKSNANITKACIKGDEELKNIKIYCVNHPQCSFKTEEYIENYDKNIGDIISDIKQKNKIDNL